MKLPKSRKGKKKKKTIKKIDIQYKKKESNNCIHREGPGTSFTFLLFVSDEFSVAIIGTEHSVAISTVVCP